LRQRLRQQSLVDNLTDPRFEKTLASYFATISAADKEGWFALFADDATSHNPVGPPPAVGREGLAEIWQVVTGPFEKISTDVDSVFHSDTGAAAKWSARGESAGGGKVSFAGITVFEFSEDARIQTVMTYWDPAEMLIALANSEPS
jgi:ketosteroid isomerase-like protein